MAAASTLQYGRQKKSVYGKASKSSWATTKFFDNSDDELAAPSPAPRTTAITQRSASVKDAYPVQKSEVKKPAPPEPVQAKPVKQDTFDVPSSEEEPSPPVKAVLKPSFRAKRPLVDDRADGDAPLASWEQKRARTSAIEGITIPTKADHSGASPDSQLRFDLAGAAKGITPKRDPSLPRTNSASLTDDANTPLSAAARLAARRRVAESNASLAAKSTNHVRTHSARTESIDSPRKRAKTISVSRGSSVDVVMSDEPAIPSCDSGGTASPGVRTERDVYDFPDSSADESSKPRRRSKSPRVSRLPARRTKPSTHNARATARKGLSTPARLAEMLPTDSDVTEASTVSPPESISRAASPRQSTTPPSKKLSSPDATVRSRGTLTPKQAQLWDRLLPSQSIAPSPSALAMKDLTISGQRPRAGEDSSTARRTIKAQSDVGRRRTRLVDRLKASVQSSSEDDSDDSSSESEEVDAGDTSNAAAKRPPLPRTASTQNQTGSAATTQSRSQTQTRSQPAVSGSTGVKRTYASQRSHLAEDNLEDDMMAGLLDDTPRQPVAKPQSFGRAHAHTKEDDLDIDDSDDAGGATGGIRSIHELRAAGRHIRGAEDIEQQLEDIENHSPGHKSRRRSALIELATKLASKTFVSRFVGQGCDVRLARQCNATKDDIADFLLAAAVMALLVADPPEHTARALQDHEVAGWLGSLLSSTTPIGEMAKIRQYNMAKASQGSLTELATLLQGQTAMWNDWSPTVVHVRLVALKALDLLVGKLRRGGDKTEMLSSDHLPHVLPKNRPASDAGLDTSLAISVLESLSTTSLSLTWDANLLRRISQTLTSLDATTPHRRHTFFLTLRLCLNLTTDNPRNSDLLANSLSVPYLLQTALEGFTSLSAETEEETRTLALDLLVLALGILINIFEHSPQARTLASQSPDAITTLVTTFTTGQQRIAEAESVAESISNVALGYLAVVLANLCQDVEARALVRAALPGRQLGPLGDAVEMFVLFHQQVDGMGFEGEEGAAVWGGFTEKLRGVLERVRGMEDGEGGMVVE